jgi:hypothetical protein
MAQVPTGIGGMTIVDSKGVTVGNVFPVLAKPPEGAIVLKLSGITQLVVVGAADILGFSEAPSGSVLFFKTTDCTGTAYRYNAPPDPQSLFVTPFVVGPRASMYVYAGTPQEGFSPQSQGDPSNCIPGPVKNGAFYAQKKLADLYDYFTPPFSLQVSAF